MTIAEKSAVTRTLVVWCPDWPAVAAAQEAGISPHGPLAIVKDGRIWVGTLAARNSGVRAGMRRRDAHYRCPELTFFPYDVSRDARLFETVVADIEQIAANVEVLRPGLVACAAGGLVRYFGSEIAAAESITDAVEAVGVECRIGIADGLETAILAARQETIVPSGSEQNFCAQLSLIELAREPAIAPQSWRNLVGLLHRIGITTAKDFSVLPAEMIATRFGSDGMALYEIAHGVPSREIATHYEKSAIAAEYHCDPPLDRVDTAAFVGRILAEKFHAQLRAADTSCTRLRMSAYAESGQELHRVWRCAQPLTAATTADRLRWQLDGWLTQYGATLGGLTLLRLEPVAVARPGEGQRSLWGESGIDESRAAAALTRIQGLLGPDAVRAAAISGGRGVTDRIRTASWGESSIGSATAAENMRWPGALPVPAPATAPVMAPATVPTVGPATVPTMGRSMGPAWSAAAVELVDHHGAIVAMTDRGLLTGAPVWASGRRVVAWAGPWLLDERWWEGAAASMRQARMQMMAVGAPPVLLEYQGGVWRVEAVYD